MFYSPLRYPGGKRKLAPFMKTVINNLGHNEGVYIEPFAGGAAIAIELLETNVVKEIVINDYDKGVYSFWRAALFETDRFIEHLSKVEISIDEWKKQREICLNRNRQYSFELGFATFYLNRTNRSGILKGGVIGGIEQKGKWKLDARFNKQSLIDRIIKIAEKRNHIHLYNKDIFSFLEKYISKYGKNSLTYLDPPYVQKGKQLYLNFFDYENHVKIEKYIKKYVKGDWIITYDNVDEIQTIYNNYETKIFDLNYSVANKGKASEIMIVKSAEIWPTTNQIKRELNINLR